MRLSGFVTDDVEYQVGVDNKADSLFPSKLHFVLPRQIFFPHKSSLHKTLEISGVL